MGSDLFHAPRHSRAARPGRLCAMLWSTLALLAAASPATASESAGTRHESGAFARRAVVQPAALPGDEPKVSALESELVFHADKASGAFHNASGSCVLVHDVAGPPRDRRLCVLTTPQGDQVVFESVTGPQPRDAYGVTRATIIGGAGRYRGIVGEITSYPTSVRTGRAEVQGRIEAVYRIVPATLSTNVASSSAKDRS